MLAGCALLSANACAESWRIQPSILLEEVLTDNVNLAPSGSAKGDLVTQLTPALRINETGPRSSFAGFVEAPILIYARTGSDNNRIFPEASLLGNVEAVEKFFYVEGAAVVRQEFLSPFGAQPVGFANATGNRLRTDSYRLSPYIQSPGGGDITYVLRDDNLWTHLSGGGSPSLGDSYTNHLIGNISRRPVPVGWEVEIDRTAEKFYGSDQAPLVTQLVRARIPFQADPTLRIWAQGGYEDNDYAFTSPKGAIYGGGAEWHYSARTKVKGEWEHRFFGSSYLLSIDERTGLATFHALASRNITSYPQQLAALPAGGDVQSILDQLLLSRIPDPTQRQTAIDDLISSGGLPPTLNSPVVLYAQQFYLQELANATLGLLGARNRVFFNVFRSRTQAIAGAGNPIPPVLGGNDHTQTGANVVLAHTLAPTLALNTSVQWVKTAANEPFTGDTRQWALLASLVSRLSPNLNAHVGVRYQSLSSDVTNSYREAAIFVGLSYICCGGSSSRRGGPSQPSTEY